MHSYTHKSILILGLFILLLIGLPLSSSSTVSASTLAESALNPTAGKTYYVSVGSGSDSNSGLSESEAFKTLNHAVSKTQPGDTVLVMNGTYIGRGSSTATLRINRAGTDDNWITYKAYPGHSPLIQSNGAWQAIRIDSPYIIVDGFRVRGIRGEVSYSEAKAAFDAYRYNGAGMTERVHGTGIKVSNYNIVRNNEVYKFGGGGIEVNKVDSVIIENNTVYDTSHYSPVGHSGISVIYPKRADSSNYGLHGSKYRIIVRGNISHSNYNEFPCACFNYEQVTDGGGIIVDVANDYDGWTLVANNLVFNNGGSGIHTYKTRNVDIINNTAYKNARHPDITGDLFARRSENVNIINNIIYARQGQRVTSDNGGTNITYAHNIYYDGTNSPTVPSGMGEGDIIGDPKFINPNMNISQMDFRLRGDSPGLDSGSDRFLPMTDILGTERPPGSTDRGAYENSGNSQPPAPTAAPTATATPQPTSTPPPAPTLVPTATVVVPQPSPPPSGNECGGLTQEAEAAQLSGAMTVGNDSAASGGKYIHAPEGTGNRGFGSIHTATFCFDVPMQDVYRLEGNIYAADGMSDSFFVTVDGLPTDGYLWDTARSTTYASDALNDRYGADPVELSLSQGLHTIVIHAREDGVRLDKLTLIPQNRDVVNQPPVIYVPQNQTNAEGDSVSYTIRADDPENQPLTFQANGLPAGLSMDRSSGEISGVLPAGSTGIYRVNVAVGDGHYIITIGFTWSVNAGSTSCGSMIQEAEAGALHGGFKVVRDANASNGSYITTEGVSSTGTIGASSYVEYCVTVPEAGDYMLEGRYKAHNYLADSFYVTVNDEPSVGYRWHLWPVNGTFVTGKLSDRTWSNSVKLSLSKGDHRIRLYLRETGAILDKFELQPVFDAAALVIPDEAREEFVLAEAINRDIEGGQLDEPATDVDPEPGSALLPEPNDDSQGNSQMEWFLYLPSVLGE